MESPERVGVELPAIEWLVALGYTHRTGQSVGQQQAHRHLPPVLDDVLVEQLLRLNPWMAAINGAPATVLRELRKFWKEDLLEANQSVWESVIHGSKIQLKDALGRSHSVRFFDQMAPATNSFHVVDQFVGTNSDGDEFRSDLLLFINGLPLAMVECKASHIKLGKGINQLLAYQQSHPRHFVFNQICVAVNRREARYGAIHTPEAFYFRYRLELSEEQQIQQQLKVITDREPTEQDKLLWALFEPSRFVELVCQFVLFEQEDDRVIKKLPRYQQWRAVRKALARLRDEDRGGVVWHTQGSGKSLTMAYLARYLRADFVGLQNPSLLVLTDRNDLDRQIFNTFTNVGLHPLKAPSVAGLQQMLGNDYGSVFTSTVQKFQERDGKPIKTSKNADDCADDEDGESSDRETRIRRIQDGDRFFICEERNIHFGDLNDDGSSKPAKWEENKSTEVEFTVLSTKANFYVLVDEAHRSQYGFLAAFMRASLPNAKFVAFTGTPLAKKDRDTLREFGAGEYIDTYRLDEAVADGATLPIKYQEGMTELTIKEELDEAFDKTFEKEDELRQAKLKQTLLKRRRTAQERIEENANHLLEHFVSSVKAKGFKGLLVCDGRDMAVRYKDTLDQLMAERAKVGKECFESRVVISLGGITESRTGVSEASADYKTLGLSRPVQTIEERVRDELKAGVVPVAVPTDDIPELVNSLFKKPYGDESQNEERNVKFCNIGLLIVSDMLLTGWDAPIVSTLYLDKPLKEHTLLQAIARVNRTRKGKNAGYIVDYYGVVEHLDEALKVYGGDVQPEQIWTDINSELPKLEAALQKVLDLLPKKHDPLKQPEQYKTDAELYLDPDVRLDVVDEFLSAFKEFNTRLDTVLPDPRGARYKPYFQVLVAIKDGLRNTLPGAMHQGPLNQLESALLQKMLDEYVEADDVRSLLGREVSILDANDMERLRKLKNVGSQALVMKNQLKHTIATGMHKNPGFYGELEDALKKLIEEEKEKRIEQAEFLLQLELFCQRVRDKASGGQQAGFASSAEIAVFDYLAKAAGESEAQSWTEALFADADICQTIASPIWKEKKEIHKDVQTLIRKKLKPLAGWDMTAARQHAAELLQILLNN